MTPLQLARQECSNMTERGACLGLDWLPDGTPCSFGAKDKCTLKTERCQFFEDCVLALADMPTASAESKEKYTLVKVQYLKGYAPESLHTCKECGQTREAGRQFCPKCSRARRREKERDRQRELKKRARLDSNTHFGFSEGP